MCGISLKICVRARGPVVHRNWHRLGQGFLTLCLGTPWGYRDSV